MLTTRRKFTLNKINANFPKVRFTYIKLTRNFRKQRAPNFILRDNILYISKEQTETSMEVSRRKTEEGSYPLGETDEYEDQSQDILNSILKEELSDSDSKALIGKRSEQTRFCY